MQNLHDNRPTNDVDWHSPLHPPPPHIRRIFLLSDPASHPTYAVNAPLLSELPQHDRHPQFFRLSLADRPDIHLPVPFLRSDHHEEATSRDLSLPAPRHSDLPPTRLVHPVNRVSSRHVARLHEQLLTQSRLR